jgi:hypothetical protein
MALVGAAVLVSALIAEQRPLRDRYAIAAVAVATAVAMALVGGNIWNSIQGLNDRAKASSGVDSYAATVAGGATLGLDTQFLEWTRRRIAEDETFYLFPAGPESDPATYQWATYQLAPRLSVVQPNGADWLMFYNVDPDAMTYDRARFDAPVRYAPNLLLAHRRAG